MEIVKRVRNWFVIFESQEHADEFMAIDDTLPPEEQQRTIDELDQKYRPAKWRPATSGGE